MKKLKKIIDFEIVTILTILILLSTFYFAIRYGVLEKDVILQESFEIEDYQILVDFQKMVNQTNEGDLFKVQILNLENKLIYNSSSDFQLIAIIAGIINIIVLAMYIVIKFIWLLIFIKNKKIAFKDDLLDELDLPQYDISIANTLYTGRISFNKIYNFLGEYFRKNEIIDKKGKINPNVNINNLSELEKDFIYLYEKEVGEETKEQFKNKIIKEFENKKYLKNNKFRVFIETFARKIESIGKKFYNLDKYDLKRTCIEAILPFVLILLVAILKYFSILVIIAIIYIQLKYYTIILTEDGKKERAKIILLVEKLKTKEELTEKEKFFYEALKYIDL